MATWLLQHRTTLRYATVDPAVGHGESPRQVDAWRWVTLAGVEDARQSLGDFAPAWRAVPLVGEDWPEEFPGAWQHWPLALQQAAGRFLVDWWMETFGPAKLIKQLGTAGDRTHPETGAVLPFTADPEQFWPLFLAHARAWHIQRALDALEVRTVRAGSPSPELSE